MALATHVSQAATSPAQRHGRPDAGVLVTTTLLDLVRVLGEITDDESEIVATALHMLRTGSVTLTGSFRDTPLDQFKA
ncbi:MAG: hypothetical protein VX466_08525 [Myxococcota bacterium]|nr:hypothetical protein [Myxococcota bacterium]